MNKSVVLVAGGPTVIGTAAAVAFAKKGARVVAAGRRDEAGKALVKELRSFGSEAEFINADVRKEDDVRALRSTRMFSASILNMKHEVRVTRGRGSGSILNISSIYGHEGVAGASVYVGSTHAVEGITKSTGIAQGSRLLRPIPDQRSIHIKCKEEVQWLT
jgi:NAD(P)-dependent dehydrogenase (short-subunit alcohol dehydrogenase family)